MSVLSGTGGIVNGKSTVRTFTVTTVDDVQEAIASNTSSGPVQIAGNDDWTGNYTSYGGLPEALPGDALAFIGKTSGTAAKWLEGTAIVDSCTIVIDIEGGKIVEHTVNFSGNGALTVDSVTAATDTSDVLTPSSVGTKLEEAPAVVLPTSPTFVAMADVRTITITLTRDNQDYVSSSTAGGTRRVAGNYSATIAVSVYQADTSLFPAKGTDHELKVYTNASEFWHFQWAKVVNVSDISSDIEGGGLVAGTINYAMNSAGPYGTSSAVVLGKIIKPGGGNWWN